MIGRLTAAGIGGCALVVGAVAVQGSPEGEARTTALAFDRAIVLHDWKSGCELLSRKVQLTLGGPSPAQCATARSIGTVGIPQVL